MTHFDDIYEIAADNYGLVTAAQAKEAGVVGAELNRYVADGRLLKRGHGLYKLARYIPTQYDIYAEAVALVGDGAHLYGEAVLALHGLALVNPQRITVATPKRIRKEVPEWVEVLGQTGNYDVVMDAGVCAQSVADAIRACRSTVMPNRLLQAVDDARAQGLITRIEHDVLKREIA